MTNRPTFKNGIWSGKINVFKNAEGRGVSLRTGHNIQSFDAAFGYPDDLSWQDLSVIPERGREDPVRTVRPVSVRGRCTRRTNLLCTDGLKAAGL